MAKLFGAAARRHRGWPLTSGAPGDGRDPRMTHVPSTEDRSFQSDFETCVLAPADFGHAAHVRLAYVYLADHDTDTACRLMQASLLRFLEHHGISPTKYHETLTRAWIMAVRHFMELAQRSSSAEAFMNADRRILDREIMLSHYSAALLFSEEARQRFVEPDLSPIPQHDH